MNNENGGEYIENTPKLFRPVGAKVRDIVGKGLYWCP